MEETEKLLETAINVPSFAVGLLKGSKLLGKRERGKHRITYVKNLCKQISEQGNVIKDDRKYEK